MNNVHFKAPEYRPRNGTPWFSAKDKPSRVGVYAMAYELLRKDRADGEPFGYGYAYWNGTEWESVRSETGQFWGQYINTPTMIWRGLTSEQVQ